MTVSSTSTLRLFFGGRSLTEPRAHWLARLAGQQTLAICLSPLGLLPASDRSTGLLLLGLAIQTHAGVAGLLPSEPLPSLPLSTIIAFDAPATVSAARAVQQ